MFGRYDVEFGYDGWFVSTQGLEVVRCQTKTQAQRVAHALDVLDRLEFAQDTQQALAIWTECVPPAYIPQLS